MRVIVLTLVVRDQDLRKTIGGYWCTYCVGAVKGVYNHVYDASTAD